MSLDEDRYSYEGLTPSPAEIELETDRLAKRDAAVSDFKEAARKLGRTLRDLRLLELRDYRRRANLEPDEAIEQMAEEAEASALAWTDEAELELARLVADVSPEASDA